MRSNQAVAGTLPLTSVDLVYTCVLGASFGSKLLVDGDIHGAVLGKSVSSEKMTAALQPSPAACSMWRTRRVSASCVNSSYVSSHLSAASLKQLCSQVTYSTLSVNFSLYFEFPLLCQEPDQGSLVQRSTQEFLSLIHI